MATVDKKSLSEQDIRTKYITPAIDQAGWDLQSQLREEVYFTKGQIQVRGKTVKRGKAKFADYLLYYKPNIPIAIVEAKDNKHGVGDGMQQALDYSEILDIPFAFSSNEDGFVFHDRTGNAATVEQQLAEPRSSFCSPVAADVNHVMTTKLNDTERTQLRRFVSFTYGQETPDLLN